MILNRKNARDILRELKQGLNGAVAILSKGRSHKQRKRDAELMALRGRKDARP